MAPCLQRHRILAREKPKSQQWYTRFSMTLPSSVTCLTSSFNSLCMPPVPASLAFVLPFGQPSPLLPQDLYTRCFPFSECFLLKSIMNASLTFPQTHFSVRLILITIFKITFPPFQESLPSFLFVFLNCTYNHQSTIYYSLFLLEWKFCKGSHFFPLDIYTPSSYTLPITK